MSPAPTVADAMIARVKLSAVSVTVGELWAWFDDAHVHSAVIVDEAGVLVAVVDRADLDGRPAHALAAGFGSLADRTVGGGGSAEAARQALLASGRRRLAVVDDDGRLLGLLCLKRTRRGFCSDRDVAARAA